MFFDEIPHLCNFKSELTPAQFLFSPAKHSKDVFCDGILHLCNLKSESAVVQFGFSSIKHSKRRILRCIIAFVQIQVGVDTCKQLIFYPQMHKKTCFVMEYRICAISSQGRHLHKSDYPQQKTQKNVFCGGIFNLWNLKSDLTVAQIGFFTVKYSKRRVLQWIIAFV